MNIAMLKFLAELANYQVDVIDCDAFFARFPRSTSSKELHSLKNLGFISLIDAEDQISEIGVSQKLIDYVKASS